jgi:hypothetical protein
MASRLIRKFSNLVARGENPNGFVATVGGNVGGGGVSFDPTQGPPSGSRGQGTLRHRHGQRWGQHDTDARDNTGLVHDDHETGIAKDTLEIHGRR